MPTTLRSLRFCEYVITTFVPGFLIPTDTPVRLSTTRGGIEKVSKEIENGRFSNGRLIPDMLASSLLHKDAIPAFLNANISDKDLLTGVNFASAGSGFDENTNFVLNVLPPSKQLSNFGDYIKRLKKVVGKDKAKAILADSLVIISAGTNDISSEKMLFNDTQYQYKLLNGMEHMVKEVHDMGCRSMIVGSLPPAGCLPIRMSLRFPNIADRKCIDEQNAYAQSYNQKLAKLLPQLQSKLSGSKLVYADIYKPLMDMIKNPKEYGFVETKLGCCGTGLVEMGPLCNQFTMLCDNDADYLFWDSIHPSQGAYKHIAQYILKHVLPKLQ
ncbi:hypothetical protein K2173_026567 [Erythroxylum novogranatense]|uniref:GDSL esterase/lipase n=1 Tax=Erythroxylum novogranatense TaxID=1862640 RepID=A0AAV8TZY1_9ROSI|nr:hypothetical protein K2173_026567 [Erythroxylum novogranatense]